MVASISGEGTWASLFPFFFLLRDGLHFHLFPLLKSPFSPKVQSFGEEYLTVISQTC